MAGDGQRFCLKWNDFRNSVTAVFEDLRQDEELVDITLCCEGKKVKAHRMMLSACSPYFRELLKENPCQHPVFFLKDTTYADLKAVIEFVYNGEVNVTQGQLSSFLKTAEMLQVRGLTGDDEKESQAPPAPPPQPPPMMRHSPAPHMAHHLPPKHRPVAPSLGPRVLPPTPLKRPLSAPQPAPTPPKRVAPPLPPPPPPPPHDSDVYVEPVVLSDSPEPAPPISPASGGRARHPSSSSGGGPATPAGSEPSGDAAPSPAEPTAQSQSQSQSQSQPPLQQLQLPPPQLQPVMQQQHHLPETLPPPPMMPAGPDGRDPAVKVEKIDIADDDVSLEQALGQVVNYEGSYDSEHSMSGLLHQPDFSQGGGSGPLPGTSDAAGIGAVYPVGVSPERSTPKFVCELCSKTYSSKKARDNHKTMHEGRTNCPLCGKCFGTFSSRNMHLRRVHDCTNDYIRNLEAS